VDKWIGSVAVRRSHAKPAAMATMAFLAFLYWFFVVAEGAYLGSRMVTLLYDRLARVYDRIKEPYMRYDRWRLAWPLLRVLSRVERPLVLDVATGTGRLPLSVAGLSDFRGYVVGVDRSARMLREAQKKTRELTDGVGLVRQDALALSFVDGSFDAVTCIEGLELFPKPEDALQEMARVLRPGGVLLISNRKGWGRLLLPRRAFHDGEIRRVLHGLCFGAVRLESWNRHYDLVWATKLDGQDGWRAISSSGRQALSAPTQGVR